MNGPFGAVPTMPGAGVPGMQLLYAFGAATMLGCLLAVSYRIAAGPGYSKDIARSQIMLAALMAMVMLVVGDNLGRAFGAVGILSVVRFRIKMRNAAEAMTLLGAVITGMAAGVGMFRVAVVGGFLLAILTLVLAGIFGMGEDEEPTKKGKKENGGVEMGDDS